LRGGSWANDSDSLRSDNRYDNVPVLEDINVGFRLASIPEPASIMLVAMFGAATLMRRKARA